MLAICCLCATLSKEDLLIAISDKKHNVIEQLKHCFKLEIEELHQRGNYVCSDCIKTLQICDHFYKKIQSSQEALRILFKAKSQLNAEKSVKKTTGTIRVRGASSKDLTGAKTVKGDVASGSNKTNFSAIEEYTCSSPTNVDLTEIKIECEDINDPLASNSNASENDSNEQNVDQSMEFESLLRNVLSRKGDTVEENIETAEFSTSDEANFIGFEQTLEDKSFVEEHLEEDTLEEDLNDQIKVSVIKYQCETCSKDFPNEVLLQKHLHFHNKERTFKCKECPKVFHHPSSFYTHLIAHQKRRLSTCRICGKSFFDQQKLTQHMDEQHAGRVWKCPKCPNAFQTITSLNNHLRLHSQGLYTCEYCYKEFRSAIWYESHLRTHSISVRSQFKFTFKCRSCSGTFLNQRSLTAHTCTKATENYCA